MMASAKENTLQDWLAQPPRISGEWSELDHVAMSIIGMVRACLATADRESELLLREAADRLCAQRTGLEWLRARCVEDVRQIGELWSAADRDDRARLLATLAWNLAVADEKFRSLLHEATAEVWPPPAGSLDWLASRLDRFDTAARGKDGRGGAARILAEILVHDADDGALGFQIAEVDPVDAVEHLRKMLGKAVRKVFGEEDPGQK